MTNTRRLALAAMVVLAACPASDDSGEDTVGASMTAATMSTTMTTAETDPATSTGEESGSSGMPECPDESLSFEADIQPIFDEHCVTDCHTMAGEWMQLILDTNTYEEIFEEDSLQTMTIDELVLIAPFDVENSYILHKMRGTQGDVVDPALSLMAMPSALMMCDPLDKENCEPDGDVVIEGEMLPDATIQIIEDWVNCGAPE